MSPERESEVREWAAATAFSSDGADIMVHDLLAAIDAERKAHAETRRRGASTPPWQLSKPPTSKEMQALRTRWAFGDERYQADFDLVMGAVAEARARADAEKARADALEAKCAALVEVVRPALEVAGSLEDLVDRSSQAIHDSTLWEGDADLNWHGWRNENYPKAVAAEDALSDLTAAAAAYRDRVRAEALAPIGAVLSANGCDCTCGHDSEGHDAECWRCLGCRVEAAMASEKGGAK